MLKQLSLFFSLTVWLGCSLSFGQSPIIFKSKIDNVHFYYLDSLGIGHPIILQKGTTKYLLNNATIILSAEIGQNPFYVQPGEEIDIDRDRNNELSLVSKNKDQNNELIFFKKLREYTGKFYSLFILNKYFNTKISQLNQLQMLENEIHSDKNKRNLYLSQYIQDNEVSVGFINASSSFISNLSIYDSLLLFWKNKKWLTKNNLLPNLLNSCIKSICKQQYLPSFLYNKVCTSASIFNFKDIPDFTIENNFEANKIYDFIEVNFAGVAKDILLSQTIYICSLNNIENKTLLNRYRIDCKDLHLNKMLWENNSILQQLSPKSGISSIQDLNGQTLDFKKIIDDNKGKLILLDFWASWCSPCRKEMPYFKKMVPEFVNKGVVFLNISIDENMADWKKACFAENLDSGKNFLMVNGLKSRYTIENKIQTIPRYILIGKDGNIISPDAPRPSNPKLKVLIDKYLR